MTDRTASPPATKISRGIIEQYLTHRARRQELEREARAVQTAEEALRRELAAYVRAHGGRQRCVLHAGYRLALVAGRALVAWKEAFIRLAGPARAAELAESAPRAEQLEVTRA